MAFNYGEFAIIKIGVIYLLPDTDILKSITVTEPVGDEKISVLNTQHISQTDKVFAIYFYDIYFGVLYCDFNHKVTAIEWR